MKLSTENMFHYQRMLDRATAGIPNKEKTFLRWQEKAIATRHAFLEVKKAHMEELAGIKETYNPKSSVYEQKVKDENDIYSLVKKGAMEKLEKELDEIVQSKRAVFDRNMDAPSEDQLRLLQALSMRENLTPGEIAAVSGKFGHNINALRVLRDIAHKHDISFPDVGDPDVFEEQITRAVQFSRDKIAKIDIDRPDLGYRDLMFFEYPGTGEVVAFYGTLDGNGLTTEQISIKKETQGTDTTYQKKSAKDTANTKQNDNTEMWARVKVSGNESLATIASQFHVSTAEIKEANAGRDISRLYSGDEIYVPSTRFTYLPDPSGGHIQPGQVKAVPKPVFTVPTGPAGENIGDDIVL